MSKADVLDLGQRPIEPLTPADIALGQLMALIPARLWPELPAVLAPCLTPEQPSLEQLGKVCQLAAVVFNADAIMAVEQLRRHRLFTTVDSALAADLGCLNRLQVRQMASENALREQLPGAAYAAFVEMGIAYDTLKTYLARVAYQAGQADRERQP
jgi:hypothetical protein